MYNQEEFADLISTYLEKKRRNQAWLAEQIGTNRQNVSRWASYSGTPPDSLVVVLKISKVLEMDGDARKRLIIAAGLAEILEYFPSSDQHIESSSNPLDSSPHPLKTDDSSSQIPTQVNYKFKVIKPKGEVNQQVNEKIEKGGVAINSADKVFINPPDREKPRILPPLEILGGLKFIYLADNSDLHTRYYLAENLISEADWEQIMKNDSPYTASSELAKVHISISDIREFCMCANAQLADEEALNEWGYKAIRIPPHDLLEEVMKQALHIVPDRGQPSPYIKKSKPTASGFYDLLGVVDQFCETSTRGYTAIGGSYKTPIKDFKPGEVRHQSLIPNDSHKEPYWGFRPLLELKHPSASSMP